MSKHPLAVESLHDMDNGNTISYYSMGHHDPQAFVDAVVWAYDVTLPIERVKHGYGRKVPAPPETAVGWMLVECWKPGPGAFPLTKVEL